MLTDQQVKEFVQQGGLIERMEEMSEGYLKVLRETLKIVADTEIMGAALYYSYLMRGDEIEEKNFRRLIALIQDEIGHAHVHYSLLEDLGGGTVEELLYNRKFTEFSYPFAMDMPIENFEEAALIATFQDRAGATLLIDPFENTSYAPWKRSLVKVEIEERFHVRLGVTFFRELAANPETKERLQRAVDWMFPLVVEWFGVPDELKKRKDQLEYRLRLKTNDQLRQDWLSQAVPLCEENGIQVPAHYDEAQGKYVLDYHFPCAFDAEQKRWYYDTPVTWDEVIKRWKSRGPCSEQNVGFIQESYKQLMAMGGIA
jgi:ring-1,2-phenylacetyl-CoA epoxidase subunit PaaA